MEKLRKLRRVVIREELVELTGDWLSALILGQFLYWTERLRDLDDYIVEETTRNQGLDSIDGDLFGWREDMRTGWFYKSIRKLKTEIMVESVSGDTVGRRINGLIAGGWVNRRASRTRHRAYHYRVDLVAVLTGLDRLGYGLEGYPLLKRGKG